MIIACDTSCYTSSVALMTMDGRLLAEERRLLSVPQGQTGLRQSEALFQHVKALPGLFERVLAHDVEHDAPSAPQILAVAASTRPRPQEASYMPVFLAGEQAARLLAMAWQAPFLAFSHQEGHIAAALWSLKLNWQERFIAVHLSGGTSELLLATPHGTGFALELIGDSDLPAGQFIDRVGVALGLPFPAGPHLEALALSAPLADLRLRGAVKDAHISFSGPESAAQRLITRGVDGAALAQAVFINIGNSLGKAINTAATAHNCQRVLVAGGVAANSLVRERVTAATPGLELCFADPAYTGDNAVGVAALAVACLRKGEANE